MASKDHDLVDTGITFASGAAYGMTTVAVGQPFLAEIEAPLDGTPDLSAGEAPEATYEGERNAAGEYEGHGTMRYPDGSVYEGDFKDGWMPSDGDYGCYNPRNFQTRSIACSTEDEMKHGAKSGEEWTADAALAKMQAAVVEKHGVVGITELYQESLCLIHLPKT